MIQQILGYFSRRVGRPDQGEKTPVNIGFTFWQVARNTTPIQFQMKLNMKLDMETTFGFWLPFVKLSRFTFFSMERAEKFIWKGTPVSFIIIYLSAKRINNHHSTRSSTKSFRAPNGLAEQPFFGSSLEILHQTNWSFHNYYHFMFVYTTRKKCKQICSLFKCDYLYERDKLSHFCVLCAHACVCMGPS